MSANALNAMAAKSDAVQISSLVEALSTAHKEMASQSEKIRVMEEALRLEREARSTAEQRIANHLQPADEKMPGSSSEETSISPTGAMSQADEPQAPLDVRESLERMNGEMDRMRQQVDAYRQRAEAAEQESQRDRQTLSEMVASIRKRDDAARKRREIRAARRQTAKNQSLSKTQRENILDENDDDLDDILDDETHRELNGRVDAYLAPGTDRLADLKRMAHAHGTQAYADTIRQFSEQELDELGKALSAIQGGQASGSSIAVRSRTHEQLAQASPYASLLGVVLLGVATMAYLNGWQKVVDR